MKKTLIVGMMLSSLSAGAIAVADTGLPDIGAHRHFLQNTDGTLGSQVGPRLCDDLESEGLQKAFNQFHSNAHVAVGGSQGPGAAPGLHDGKGYTVVARGCSFVAP